MEVGKRAQRCPVCEIFKHRRTRVHTVAHHEIARGTGQQHVATGFTDDSQERHIATCGVDRRCCPSIVVNKIEDILDSYVSTWPTDLMLSGFDEYGFVGLANQIGRV